MSRIVNCYNVPEILSGLVIYIDGQKVKTESQYILCIGTHLNIPDYKECNWSSYVFWMKNLTWIPEQKISIIITNYECFLSESPSAKSAFIFDFKMVIFPFWKKDGMYYYEDKKYIKDIDVYIVN